MVIQRRTDNNCGGIVIPLVVPYEQGQTIGGRGQHRQVTPVGGPIDIVGRAVGHWRRNLILKSRQHPAGIQVEELHREVGVTPGDGYAGDSQLRAVGTPSGPAIGIPTLQGLGQQTGAHIAGKPLVASAIGIDQSQVAAVVNVCYPVHHRRSISITFGLHRGGLRLPRRRLLLAAARQSHKAHRGHNQKQQPES